MIKIGEVDLNFLVIKGIFFLYEVVLKGFVDSVKVFFENVIIVNVWNLEGFLFLDVVVEMGNFECVELLIRYGVLIENIKDGFVLRLRILWKVFSSM